MPSSMMFIMIRTMWITVADMRHPMMMMSLNRSPITMMTSMNTTMIMITTIHPASEGFIAHHQHLDFMIHTMSTTVTMIPIM